MVLDSSFGVDQFRLHIRSQADGMASENDTVPMELDLGQATAAPASSAAASAAVASSSKAADVPVHFVRLEHIRTGLFLTVKPHAVLETDAHGVSSLPAALVRGPPEWQKLMLWDKGSHFQLASEFNGAQLLLHTAKRTDGGSPMLRYVVQRAANQPSDADTERRDAVLASHYDSTFYFAELQAGYRSLDLHLASQGGVDVPRLERLLRADPLFATNKVSPALSLFADWKAHKSEFERCRYAGQLGCKVSHGDNVCFQFDHVLLADYIYAMMRAKAAADEESCVAPASSSASHLAPRPVKLIGDRIHELVQEYVSTAPVLAACPLLFVSQFYQKHAQTMLRLAFRSSAKTTQDAGVQDKRRAAVIFSRRHLTAASREELLKDVAFDGASFTAMDASFTATASFDAGLVLASMTETEHIVSLLLPSLVRRPVTPQSPAPQPGRGKMVVLRVSSNKEGYAFEAGLLHAFKVAKIDDFAVVPDFGSTTLVRLNNRYTRRLQANRCCKECACAKWQPPDGNGTCCAAAGCGHVHHEVVNYTDLLNLPCMVLLNEKGRMGDTFPHSFACMDLRLRYTEAPGNCRSVTQELGRVCRYVVPKLLDGRIVCSSCGEQYEHDRAYILVGRGLTKDCYMKGTFSLPQLQNRLPELSDKLLKKKNLESKRAREIAAHASGLPVDHCSFTHEPHAKNYDFSNPVNCVHPRRFVLSAECQIGKTGTYLSLISQLKDAFDPQHARGKYLDELSIRLDDVELPADHDFMQLHPIFTKLDKDKFPKYDELGFGKYHGRIAHDRLAVLLRGSADLTLRQRVEQFLQWLPTGELPVCRQALERVAILSSQVKAGHFDDSSHSALTLNSDASALLTNLLPAINWDGRMGIPANALAGAVAVASCSDPWTHATRVGLESIRARLLKDAQSFVEGTFVSSLRAAENWDLPARPDRDARPAGFVVSRMASRTPVARPSNGSQKPTDECIELQFVVANRSPAVSVNGGERHPLLASDTIIRVSAPSLQVAEAYFELLPVDPTAAVGAFRSIQCAVSSHPVGPRIHSWIFNCTYNRHGEAMLDYRDVMLDHESVSSDGATSGRVVPLAYQRVIVVRAEEFEAQVQEWGGSAVIMALPASCLYPMYDNDDVCTSVLTTFARTGGIGYARLCVQIIGHMWGLPAVWMLDDNCEYFMHAIAAASAPAARDGSGTLTQSTKGIGLEDNSMHDDTSAPASSSSVSCAAAARSGTLLRVCPVSFAMVLRRLEQLLWMDSLHPELKAQCGSSSRYCVIGMARDIRNYHVLTQARSMMEPGGAHRRRHCYSACLVNLQVCFPSVSSSSPTPLLLFPPRPLMEDVEFNFLAEQSGKMVVKYSRFMHFKKNLTRAQPKPAEEAKYLPLFLWRDNTQLITAAPPPLTSCSLPPAVMQWLSDPSPRVSRRFLFDELETQLDGGLREWEPAVDHSIHVDCSAAHVQDPLSGLHKLLRLAAAMLKNAAALVPPDGIRVTLHISMVARMLRSLFTPARVQDSLLFQQMQPKVSELFQLLGPACAVDSLQVLGAEEPLLNLRTGVEEAQDHGAILLRIVLLLPRMHAASSAAMSHTPGISSLSARPLPLSPVPRTSPPAKMPSATPKPSKRKADSLGPAAAASSSDTNTVAASSSSSTVPAASSQSTPQKKQEAGGGERESTAKKAKREPNSPDRPHPSPVRDAGAAASGSGAKSSTKKKKPVRDDWMIHALGEVGMNGLVGNEHVWVSAPERVQYFDRLHQAVVAQWKKATAAGAAAASESDGPSLQQVKRKWTNMEEQIATVTKEDLNSDVANLKKKLVKAQNNRVKRRAAHKAKAAAPANGQTSTIAAAAAASSSAAAASPALASTANSVASAVGTASHADEDMSAFKDASS